jgi:hypothetical protein
MSDLNIAQPGRPRQDLPGAPLHTTTITFERPRIFRDAVPPIFGHERDWLAALNSVSAESLLHLMKINGQPLSGFTSQELQTFADELHLASCFLRGLIPIYARAEAAIGAEPAP